MHLGFIFAKQGYMGNKYFKEKHISKKAVQFGTHIDGYLPYYDHTQEVVPLYNRTKGMLILIIHQFQISQNHGLSKVLLNLLCMYH